MKLKLKQGKRSDTSYELTMLSKDMKTSLEKVTKDFWELMLRNNESIENAEEREITVVNYLASTLYSIY